jgi:hypothetical protein
LEKDASAEQLIDFVNLLVTEVAMVHHKLGKQETLLKTLEADVRRNSNELSDVQETLGSLSLQLAAATASTSPSKICDSGDADKGITQTADAVVDEDKRQEINSRRGGEIYENAAVANNYSGDDSTCWPPSSSAKSVEVQVHMNGVDDVDVGEVEETYKNAPAALRNSQALADAANKVNFGSYSLSLSISLSLSFFPSRRIA